MNSLINGDSRTSRSLLKIARELKTTPAFLTGEVDDPDADAPESPTLSSEELELLELFRSIEAKERAAILTLARSIATNARSPTVHGQGQTYRAQG